MCTCTLSTVAAVTVGALAAVGSGRVDAGGVDGAEVGAEQTLVVVGAAGAAAVFDRVAQRALAAERAHRVHAATVQAQVSETITWRALPSDVAMLSEMTDTVKYDKL